MIHLSKCCNPVPGEQIIGFITRGRGLSVHTIDCPNIDQFDYSRERLVSVEWDKEASPKHSILLSVLTLDQPGMLASVSAAIAETGANISHAEVKTTADHKGDLHIVVDIINIKHLEKVIKKIEGIKDVLQARRIRGN